MAVVAWFACLRSPQCKLDSKGISNFSILLCLLIISVSVGESLQTSLPVRDMANETHRSTDMFRDSVIHERFVSDTSNDNLNHLVLKLDKDYTPFQIADYIFSTGDEKGVSQLISEMVLDGQLMASGDDIIRFLEEVQRELETMKKGLSLN